MGGKDKGMDFSSLREALKSKVRYLVLYGEAARSIASQIDGCVPVILEERFDRAVERAWEVSREGDAIVLSPGCASFDQFSSYEERGERFNELVRSITCDG